MSIMLISAVKDKQKMNLLYEDLKRMKEEVKVFDVCDMHIKHCIGCNACWLVTPGTCVLQDDYEDILKAYITYDKVLFLSDTMFGSVISTTKHVIDRMVPLATMYLTISNGQLRHVPRYRKKLKMGLIYTGDLKRSDLDAWFSRVMLNFYGTSLGVVSFEERQVLLSCI